VRTALPTDSGRVAAVYLASWRAAFGHLLPADLVTDAHLLAKGAAQVDAPVCMVGEVRGVVRCFGAGDPASGLLDLLYSEPDAWGTGVADAVLEAVTAALTSGGHQPWLWAWKDNQRALAFYRRHDWATDGETRTALIGDMEFRYLRMTSPHRP